MEIVLIAACLILWVGSGIWGMRLIVDLWFSGGLRDIRPERLSASYIIIGVFGGPINLLLAAAWFAMGMGRNDST